MNRRTIPKVAAVVAVICYVVFRLVSATTPNRQPPGPDYPVIQRQVDGHTEIFTRWRQLEMGSAPSLDWSATWNANPTKPAFTLSLRGEDASWGKKEADATSPIILECDGETIRLRARWGTINVNGKAWGVVVGEGDADHLAKAADSRTIRLTFGGHSGELGEAGLKVLKELRRRASDARGT